MTPRTLSLLVLPCVLAVGCDPAPPPASGSGTPGAASAATASAAPVPSGAAPVASAAPPTATAGVVVAVPEPAEKVAKTVNPLGEAPYNGKKGSIHGVVRIEGDPPPANSLAFPKGCGEAAATYGRQYRMGAGGAVADVLVAATGYHGFVPPREPAVKVPIHGCAFQSRTVAMTFGQRLEVANLDKTESYMPYLDGGDVRTIMVAMPGGEAIKLYPPQAGRYMLRDQLPKPFMTADVYVLAYATHDVTSLDGSYRIEDVPVGKVKVSAYLPALDRTVEQLLDVVEGDNSLDLKLTVAPPPAKPSEITNPPTPRHKDSGSGHAATPGR